MFRHLARFLSTKKPPPHVVTHAAAHVIAPPPDFFPDDFHPDWMYEKPAEVSRLGGKRFIDFCDSLEGLGEEELQAAFQYFMLDWGQRVQHDLGADFRRIIGTSVQLITARPSELAENVLIQAERTRGILLRDFSGVASPDHTPVPHLIVELPDAETFYRYVDPYCPDGESEPAGGVLLRWPTFPHIALNYCGWAWSSTLTHEFMHLLCEHLLDAPYWLHEALAMAAESKLHGTSYFLEATDLEEHVDYWNAETIQYFWAGVNWGPLSYALAHMLFYRLSSDLPRKQRLEKMREFITNASFEDGGIKAALDIDIELTGILTSFLGPGHWQPDITTLAELRSTPTT